MKISCHKPERYISFLEHKKYIDIKLTSLISHTEMLYL